jgi:hypothetical protein
MIFSIKKITWPLKTRHRIINIILPLEAHILVLINTLDFRRASRHHTTKFFPLITHTSSIRTTVSRHECSAMCIHAVIWNRHLRTSVAVFETFSRNSNKWWTVNIHFIMCPHRIKFNEKLGQAKFIEDYVSFVKCAHLELNSTNNTQQTVANLWSTSYWSKRTMIIFITRKYKVFRSFDDKVNKKKTAKVCILVYMYTRKCLCWIPAQLFAYFTCPLLVSFILNKTSLIFFNISHYLQYNQCVWTRSYRLTLLQSQTTSHLNKLKWELHLSQHQFAIRILTAGQLHGCNKCAWNWEWNLWGTPACWVPRHTLARPTITMK